MKKYTQGPWTMDNNTVWDGKRVSSVIASLPSAGPNFDNLANAKLIAAAPELVEALENLLLFIKITYKDSKYEKFEAIVKAIETLEKATGELYE